MSNNLHIQDSYPNHLEAPDAGTIAAGAVTDISRARMPKDSFMPGDGVCWVNGAYKRITEEADIKDFAGIVILGQLRAPGESDDGNLTFEILTKGKIYVKLAENVKANDQAVPSVGESAGLWRSLDDTAVKNPTFFVSDGSVGKTVIVSINGRIK